MSVELPDGMTSEGISNIKKVIEAGASYKYVARLDDLDIYFYDPNAITWHRRNLKKLPSWQPVYQVSLVFSKFEPKVTIVLRFNKQTFIDGIALAHSIAEATNIRVKMETKLPDFSYTTIYDLDKTRQKTTAEVEKLETALKMVTALL